MSNDIIKNVAVEGGEGGDAGGSSTGTPVSLPTDTTTGGGDGGDTGAGTGSGTSRPPQSVTYLKFDEMKEDRVYRTVKRYGKMSYQTFNESVELVNATWLYKNSTADKWEKIVGPAGYNPRSGGPTNAEPPFFQRRISPALGCFDSLSVLTCN